MKKYAILTGGTSEEREIALKSADTFRTHLTHPCDVYVFPEERDDFLQNLSLYDTVIPVFHGAYGEDGKLSAFLEVLDMKVCLSPFATHALGLNKYFSNSVVQNIGIKVPQSWLDPEIHEISNFPVIIKPNTGGSSLYTYKIKNAQELHEKLTITKAETQDQILVQEFIAGDEYSVSIVAGKVLPIMKLQKPSPDEIFDYENKYSKNPTIKETWPEIEAPLSHALSSQAQKIYTHLGCKGYARVDFLVKGDEIYFLEINTIPGMSPASIVPKSWLKTGRELNELIQTIIND